MYELLGPDYAHYDTITEEEYLARVPEFRERLERNVPEDYDAAQQISNDSDVAQTYRGYKKFLETERDVQQSRSRSDKENANIAKRMLRRGKVCFCRV